MQLFNYAVAQDINCVFWHCTTITQEQNRTERAHARGTHHTQQARTQHTHTKQPTGSAL
jgi:hypothetical protein